MNACPLATAWCRVAWECALAEVDKRYGSEDKLVFRRKATAAGQEEECQWTMRQLCERLHINPATAEDDEVRISQLCALHWHLHEKLPKRDNCSVCGDISHIGKYGEERLASPRHCETVGEWRFLARQALWQAIQDTVRRSGCAWSIWRPMGVVAPPPVSLPPKLQLECVPMDKIESLPKGLCPWANTATLLWGEGWVRGYRV